MQKLLFWILLALAASPTLSVGDRRCGSDTSHLWLDVVFVIDNSKSMAMYQVFDTIQALFNQRVQIGTGYSDPRSTRVGFITYNYNATDVADFYKLQSWSDLNSQIQRLKTTPLSNVVYSYMDTGLNAAANMISSSAGYRDNYKKLIVLFTSNYGYYRSYPKDVAKTLKSNGVSIVTVNTGGTKSVTTYLQQIASDNMNFTFTDGNTTQEILKAMTDTNCFCPLGWTQYSWPMNDMRNRYGICVQHPGTAGNRIDSQNACHRFTNGYLVNELDQQKRTFNFQFMQSAQPLNTPTNAFYNGLTSLNGTWYWDQPSGEPLLRLDPNSGSPPPRSGCVADMKYSDGSTSWTPVSCANNFQILCESRACDTDNYCEEV